MEDINNIVLEARECHRDGRFEQAKRQYTSALDALNALPLHEDNKTTAAMIYNERGLSHYMSVCFDKAVEDYTSALKLNPSLAAAYYNRATIRYRLLAGFFRGTREREALARDAMEDFNAALRLDPHNIEFLAGLRSCENEMQEGQGDGSVNLLRLESESLPTLVKLLFLLGKHDQEKFLAIMKAGEQAHQQVVSLLQRHAEDLLKRYEECQASNLPANTEAARLYGVKKEEEDLMVLVKCCDHLGIEYCGLNGKIRKIENKMNLKENEKAGNFFINAENLLMSDICDCLTSQQVYKLFCLAVNKNGWKFLEGQDASMVKEEHLHKEEMKNALFFFIIRQMEEKRLLNRIYTDKLQGLFKELCEDNGNSEKLNACIQKLKNYPDECQPPGLCLIFCVKKNREGSDVEVTKIKSVFQDLFKFTVEVEVDPNVETLQRYHKKLLEPKYKFYDSLVIWFVSHGNEEDLILDEDETYNREAFIDDFSRISTFNMKPKIFFMGTCRGNNPLPFKNSGDEKPGGTDGCSSCQEGQGSNRWGVNVPLNSQDITNIYYQMDRIVSYATLPSYTAFRVKDEGSVFVDTVCAQLEESQGQNITQVLETTCQIIHQIVFCIEEREDLGSTKQACFYESTFQKTFLVPSVKSSQS